MPASEFKKIDEATRKNNYSNPPRTGESAGPKGKEVPRGSGDGVSKPSGRVCGWQNPGSSINRQQMAGVRAKQNLNFFPLKSHQ